MIKHKYFSCWRHRLFSFVVFYYYIGLIEMPAWILVFSAWHLIHFSVWLYWLSYQFARSSQMAIFFQYLSSIAGQIFSNIWFYLNKWCNMPTKKCVFFVLISVIILATCSWSISLLCLGRSSYGAIAHSGLMMACAVFGIAVSVSVQKASFQNLSRNLFMDFLLMIKAM